MVRVNKYELRHIIKALTGIPGLAFSLGKKPDAQGRQSLCVTSKETGEFSFDLTILWAGRGWPAEAQQAIADVPDPWPRHLVVAARSLSPGALEKLRKRDANWVDEAGNVRLHVPPRLFVMKEANAKERKKAPAFSWSSSSTALAEFLLANKPEKIELNEIAGKTGWSVPQVSNVLRAFDKAGWTSRHGPPRGRGVWRELANRGALLEAWSAHLVDHRPKRHLGHRLLRDPVGYLSGELAPLLNNQGKWAVTGWAGLEISAPYISFIPSLQVYLPSELPDRDLFRIFEKGGISMVEEGANVEFWEMDFPLLTAPDNASIVPVVNLPRLYSDLLAIGGRAKDGAEHLREIRIGY